MAGRDFAELRALALARTTGGVLPANLDDVEHITGGTHHSDDACAVCNGSVPGKEVGFLLIYSGKKLSATHRHLHFDCPAAWQLALIERSSVIDE
jgi:hypothetical protein